MQDRRVSLSLSLSLCRPQSSGIVYGLGDFFADQRITVSAYYLIEPHLRNDDVDVVPCADESLDLGILKPCVGEHGGNVGVNLTGDVEQHGAVLAPAETHAHLSLVVLIPLYDAGLRDLYLPVERQRLEFLQPLGIMDCICYRASSSLHPQMLVVILLPLLGISPIIGNNCRSIIDIPAKLKICV